MTLPSASQLARSLASLPPTIKLFLPLVSAAAMNPSQAVIIPILYTSPHLAPAVPFNK